MSYLEQAADPNLTPQQFKTLLDVEDEFVYETLDLNDVAASRYMDYLDNLPEPELFPPEGITEDQALALANNNDHLGQFAIGDIEYNRGNLDQAKHWFLLAAQNGNMVCMLNYALLTDNPEERGHWLKKSALKGMPNAQRELGRDYWAEGDTRRALLWLGCASRRGLAAAFSDLGALNWELGNKAQAIENWRIAADAGDEQAATNLANFDSGALLEDGALFDDDDLFENDEETTQFSSTTSSAPTGNPKPQDVAAKAAQIF